MALKLGDPIKHRYSTITCTLSVCVYTFFVVWRTLESCDDHVIIISRCLTGCGESIEGVVTSEMSDRFQEVTDSLQAIGFTKQVMK